MDKLIEKECIDNYAKELKLSVMRLELDAMIETATLEEWNYYRLLRELLEKEYESRTEKRKKQRIHQANFSELKYLEELEVKELPKDAQVALNGLETLEFIQEGRNVVLYGNPGTGKTHIAIALAIKACEQDMTVMFTTVPRLLTQIRECRSQKKLKQLERNFEKFDLVICDEFGYVSCDKEGGELLFNHLSLRAGKKSTIITTNLAFNRWNEIIKDKVLVAAMVDRLTHKAFIINMTGDSYRLKETKKIMTNLQNKKQ
jgi:DNA replication protein DnaC